MPAMALHKTMWVQRARTLSFWLLAVLVAASIGVLATKPAYAATYFVNSTSDSGDKRPGNGSCFTGVKILHDDGSEEGECTLRAAIQEANAVAGADTINFGILSTEDANCDETTDVCTISPSSELPTITDEVSIDGYTQPGASENTLAVGDDAVLRIGLNGRDVGFEEGLNGLVIEADDSVVRGLVINRFIRGIVLSGADNTRIEGNFIGIDPGGSQPPGNGYGVQLHHFNDPSDNPSDNIIGGTSPGARNIISGNNEGIFIASGTGSTGNKVQGNYIGTTKSGTGDLGNNSSGVLFVSQGSDNTAGSNNTIGGIGAARNTIAFNGGDGVRIDSNSTTHNTGNAILRNSIFSNADLGIDLGQDGKTANDPGDSDSGPNNLQNFPGISSAVTFGASTTIKGGLNSTPNTTFTIQFFSSPAPDPSGFGEGKTFLGQTSVTTNSNGNRSFTFVPAQKVPVGWRVTATATGVGGTSEFSRARLVERPVIGS